MAIGLVRHVHRIVYETFGTYRVVVGDVMLLEVWNGDVITPGRRITRTSQKDCTQIDGQANNRTGQTRSSATAEIARDAAETVIQGHPLLCQSTRHI